MFDNDYEIENNQNSVIRNKQDDTLYVLKQYINQYYSKEKPILDLGSGDGHYHKYFENPFVGLDRDKEYKGKKTDVYIKQDLESFPYKELPKEKLPFKFVVALDVFEHLVRPDMVLQYIKQDHRLFDNKCYVFLSVPNINTLDDKLLNINTAAYFPELKKHTSGRWNASHLRFFDLQSLIYIAENTGYKIVTMSGSNFHTSNLFGQLGNSFKNIGIDGINFCNALRNTEFSLYAPNLCILLQKK